MSNLTGARTRELKQGKLKNISLDPGTYVVAVSGGVDSIVLLHLLKNRANLKLVVAHFDHGIRVDSGSDRLFVQKTAAQLDLPFVYESAKLGKGSSEAAARTARYKFLEQARKSHDARAILTAHHQDDVLETALINIIRGTNRRGLTSLSSRQTIIRPLLNMSKKAIKAYAQSHGLTWREDSTNEDEAYLRNYVRRRMLPKFDAHSRSRLLNIIEQTRGINDELDAQMINLMHIQPSQRILDRAWFISLPHGLGREFLATWLRLRGVGSFDAKALERLVVGAKVNRPGSLINISGSVSLAVGRDHLALVG